jgi:RNA polymerase sigma factor (sigma-70 family)
MPGVPQLLDRNPSPEDTLMRQELRRDLQKGIESLTDRERGVLVDRFGAAEMSLEDSRKGLDVTRERCRQIEARALRKLKHPSNSRHLVAHDVVPKYGGK